MRHGMPPIVRMQTKHRGIRRAVALRRRRSHADGGLLHPDALGDEPAAHARQPDDPRQPRTATRTLPRPSQLGASAIRVAVPGNPVADARRTALPAPLTTRDVLRYATMNGAKALRLDRKAGSLTPGKEADIIILDATRINVVPLNQVPGAVVSLMDRTNVETVIVAGKIRNGRDSCVERSAARRRSAAAAPAARGVARLHFQCGGRSAESVQQPVSRRFVIRGGCRCPG